MKRHKLTSLVGALMALALAAAACGGGGTPTATVKAFYDAAKAKDGAGIKATLSKSSLETLETLAKARGKTLDEALKEPGTSSQPPDFEAKDEKITGDTATVQVKGQNGSWETVPLVKEDGKWKIALDKAFGGAKP